MRSPLILVARRGSLARSAPLRCQRERWGASAHRPPHHRRKIPDEMRDKCLNCLSPNHRITTCGRPLRCLRYNGYRHFARECKRPRSPTNSGIRSAVPDRFVRARRDPDSVDTPEGSRAGGATLDNNDTPTRSQATGPTPPNSPSLVTARSPGPSDRDPLPPGHPDI